MKGKHRQCIRDKDKQTTYKQREQALDGRKQEKKNSLQTTNRKQPQPPPPAAVKLKATRNQLKNQNFPFENEIVLVKITKKNCGRKQVTNKRAKNEITKTNNGRN